MTVWPWQKFMLTLWLLQYWVQHIHNSDTKLMGNRLALEMRLLFCLANLLLQGGSIVADSCTSSNTCRTCRECSGVSNWFCKYTLSLAIGLHILYFSSPATYWGSYTPMGALCHSMQICSVCVSVLSLCMVGWELEVGCAWTVFCVCVCVYMRAHAIVWQVSALFQQSHNKIKWNQQFYYLCK